MAEVGRIRADIPSSCDPGDWPVVELAIRQHDVVAGWQLRALGINTGAIKHRVKVGRLHRIHLGVYAVGSPNLTIKGHWMAAVLAGGPDAVLSHRAAAALWDLRRPPTGPIDVTVPTRNGRKRRTIRIHRSGRLHPDDRTTRHNIPVTSLERTLLDYAEIETQQWFEYAFDEAERQELIDFRAIEATLAREPGPARKQTAA
jgi:hypothetical protein